MTKLAIVTTHPVQYNAPWFRLLAQRGVVAVKVFYTWSQLEAGPKYDPDFKKVIEWDLPLLDGYEYEFVANVSTAPGSHHYRGMVNPGLNKTIEQWGADAVLVIGWAFKSHLACMRHFKNKLPVLFRGDSTLLDEAKGVKTGLRRLFLTWVYRHVDTALYAGTNNKKYFRAHGVKESQLIPAFHAVDNARFAANPTERRQQAKELRSRLHIGPDDFVVLFAGKFEEKKNPFFILELAKKITDHRFIFLLAGNGHLEEQLKAQAAIDRRIRFLPFQNQTGMPAVYSSANVYLLPSKGPGETWGLAANEAMACGLPVLLSSKAGGAIDLVNGNGLIFGPEEIGRVANYLEVISNAPAQYEQAGEASRQHIRNFSFLQIAEAVEIGCLL